MVECDGPSRLRGGPLRPRTLDDRRYSRMREPSSAAARVRRERAGAAKGRAGSGTRKAGPRAAGVSGAGPERLVCVKAMYSGVVMEARETMNVSRGRTLLVVAAGDGPPWIATS